MSNNSKIASLVLVLLLSFAALPSFTKSATATSFEILSVEVNGDVASSTDVVSVERGDTVDVKVRLLAKADADSVRVKAEIKGLEEDDIEDKTDLFDVKNGTTYVKTLQLEIPSDLSENDLDEEFTLEVEASNKDESDVRTTGLIVTSARHDLKVQDVVFRTGSNVNPGDNLYATVWVENKGTNDEEDISVKVSVPQLGLSARDIIDELVSAAHEDSNTARDRDTDTAPVNFAFKVPSDAKAGDYDLVVEVDYNRGKETVRTTETFTVSGPTTQAGTQAETIVTVDTTSQSVKQGEGAIYKFSFANLGKTAKTFSVDVMGVESWATTRVDPATVTVQPGATSEAFVFVSAKDDASTGKHAFTANVKEGSTLLKAVGLEADVAAKEGTPTAVTGAASWDQVRKGLEIGFAVLLIILVILGIIIAVGKIRKGDGAEEEPGQGEGQSYYYYPRY